MEKWIELANDLCVIIFDLLLYTQMTVLRGRQSRSRKILYAGCAVIVAFYTVAVFILNWAVSVSALVCMTLPSLVLFFALSKYRDARFFSYLLLCGHGVADCGIYNPLCRNCFR